MNHRRRTWPLLAGALWLTALGTAWGQTIRFDPPARPGNLKQGVPLQPPSHMRLDQDLNDLSEAGQLLDQRLKSAREAHELEKVPDLLQRLAQDPEFVKNLQKGMTPEQQKQLAQLGHDLMQGRNPGENPAWAEFLKGLRSQPGDLEQVLKDKFSKDDADLLKRWAEKKQAELGQVPDGTGNGPSMMPRDPARPPDPVPAPPPSGASGWPEPSKPAGPSLWQRMEEKTDSWFKEHAQDWAKDMGEWADSPLGEAVRNVLRRAGTADGAAMPFDLSDKARGLSGPLKRLGEYLPTERLRSADLAAPFRNLRMPRMPSANVNMQSVGAVPAPSGSGLVSGLLWALVLLTLGGVLWKSLRWYQEKAAAADGWQLGPWPVRPDAVATRADLVRAFEYLALLCFGPAALAWNHLDLASRLGTRGAADLAQREAAEHLARLYERARYAPGDEPLPPEALAAARRDLCLLAGVAAA